MSHRLDWQDDHMALLATCNGAKIVDGPLLHVDSNLTEQTMEEQRCPVCGQRLRLVWDVRAEVR